MEMYDYESMHHHHGHYHHHHHHGHHHGHHHHHHQTLAWHETLELHELVTFQSTGLEKLKSTYCKISCSHLRHLYKKAIEDLEMNLCELLQFYSHAPEARGDEEEDMRDYHHHHHYHHKKDAFYAGELLGLSKCLIQKYAAAITETATPALRHVFEKQLKRAIKLHAKTFHYMYEQGLYPAYDLRKMLRLDVKNAHQALTMPYS